MPKLILNDEEYEIRINEKLLSVGRRQGAHIGFMCLGRGYCHTCACHILSGEEHLSPITEKEEIWHKKAHLRDNYRLACQTYMVGPGPVVVISRAEELRRQASNVLAPPEGTSSFENLSELIGNIGSIAVHVPSDIAGVATHIGKTKIFPSLEQSETASKVLNSKTGEEIRDTWEQVNRTTKRYGPNMKIIRRMLDDTSRMAQNMVGSGSGLPFADLFEEKRSHSSDEEQSANVRQSPSQRMDAMDEDDSENVHPRRPVAQKPSRVEQRTTPPRETEEIAAEFSAPSSKGTGAEHSDPSGREKEHVEESVPAEQPEKTITSSKKPKRVKISTSK